MNGGSERGRGFPDALSSWKFVRCFSLSPWSLGCKVHQELLAAPPEIGTGVPPSLKSPWLTCRLKREQVFHGLATIHGLKPYIAFIDLVLAGCWSTYTTVCVWLQPGLAVSLARGTPGSLCTLWDPRSSSFHVVATTFSICVEQHLFGLLLNVNSLIALPASRVTWCSAQGRVEVWPGFEEKHQ